ncbi:MAG: hypothetical protein AB7O38_21980 [Pirellulaceae bacterium]
MLDYCAIAAFVVILGVTYIAFHASVERSRASRLSRRPPLSAEKAQIACAAYNVRSLVAVDIVREGLAVGLNIPVACVYPADRFVEEYRLPWSGVLLDEYDEVCHQYIQRRLREMKCPAWSMTTRIHNVADLICSIDQHLARHTAPGMEPCVASAGSSR